MDQRHSVQEIADRLGVSNKTMYEICRKRLISHIRIGDRILISDNDVADFISRHTVLANVRSGIQA